VHEYHSFLDYEEFLLSLRLDSEERRTRKRARKSAATWKRRASGPCVGRSSLFTIQSERKEELLIV